MLHIFWPNFYITPKAHMLCLVWMLLIRHGIQKLRSGGGSLADCSRVPVLAFELCIMLLISQCRRGVLLAVNLFVEGTQYGQLWFIRFYCMKFKFFLSNWSLAGWKCESLSDVQIMRFQSKIHFIYVRMYSSKQNV